MGAIRIFLDVQCVTEFWWWRTSPHWMASREWSFPKKNAFSSPGSYFFTARNDCQVNERMDRLPHGYIERNAYIYIYVHIILLMVQKSGDHQLRLVVYPIIYRVLAPSQVVVRDFWTINGVNKTNFHVKQFRMPSLEFGLPSPQSVSQFDPNCCASSDFLIPNPTTPPTDYFCRTSSHPWQFCEFCGRKETDRIRRLSKNFQRFLSFFFLSKKTPTSVFGRWHTMPRRVCQCKSNSG